MSSSAHAAHRRAGYRAALAGMPKDACPYDEKSRSSFTSTFARHWKLGWDEGAAERAKTEAAQA